MPVAVFITCNMDQKLLDRFLDGVDSYAIEEGREQSRTRDELHKVVQFMTTTTYGQRPEPAVNPYPIFNSPFVGQDAQQLGNWFKGAVGHDGLLLPQTFIILDSQSAQDYRTCVAAAVAHWYEPVMTMRCDFYAAMSQSLIFGFPDTTRLRFDGYSWGQFMRSRIVMTKKNIKSAMRGYYLPVEDGVFTLDREDEWPEGYISEDG